MLLRQILSENLLSTTPGTTFNIRNTPVFNILRANSFFAIFYADFFRRHAANSSMLKDLELRSGFFLIQIDPPKPTTSQTLKGTRLNWQYAKRKTKQKENA
jgi:hypothetical protein